MEKSLELDAFEQLSLDHQQVSAKLSELEALFSDLPSELSTELEAKLKGFMQFIDEEVWAHFHFEEESLFPLLDAHFPGENAPVAGGPVRVLREEHKIIRRLFQRFEQAIRSSQADWKAGAEVRLTGVQLATAFHKHIYKEDFVVFRLAKNLLSEEERRRLNEVWDRSFNPRKST
ncbi:MAG: hemerythrin domain-containing protein [Armatimonadetes bacterium]|nr:hemerythrin domain-containing protein [Armatimonadota bacterium]